MSGKLNKERNPSNLTLKKYNSYSPHSSDDEFDLKSNKEFENNKMTNKFNTINPNQERGNKRNISQTTKHGKVDRVRKLSEKLSNLQVDETPNPAKLNKLETKFESVEENLSYTLGTLKSKYNTIKEHTTKMKNILETETMNKDELRKNITERLKNLQTRVKTILLEEKEHFKEYTENITNKLEAELIKCETDVKRDEDSLLKNITDFKDNIRVINKNIKFYLFQFKFFSLIFLK